MNKLEEYRTSTPGQVYKLGDANNDLAAGGFLRGFDAAIALDLPVKFLDWILTVESSWVNSMAKWVVAPDLEFTSNKELYQYWIDNIYKPE